MIEMIKQFFLNKTVLTNIVTPPIGMVVAWLASKGFALTPDQVTQMDGGCVAAAMFLGNIICEHLTGPGIATPTPRTHFGAKP